MAKPVLEVKNLTKVFGGRKRRTVAVDNISFKIDEGEIVGLLGPNGAGKTTTTQILLGTTSKTSGEIKYFGKEFEKHRSEILQQVNYASAYTRLPWNMTVGENLMVYAMLYQVKEPKKRIEMLLEQFEMQESIKKPIRELSSGQTTRIILTKAFINFPKLLLLDEPTASLDPEVADKVRKFLLKQQKKYNVAMLFTSHNMAEVTEVCDRVIFLRKGKIVAEDTPSGLARRIKTCVVRYKVDGQETVMKIREEEIALFLEDLAKREIKYEEISIDKPTLEDYFLSQSKEENGLGES
ncbi:MAG: ABC transporter, ATPase subunit [Candidatus Beckwithbacteria bacterium GW2011_GWA2_43_10]|uniref:ABC transporter, ATPase subunit n=1 Tax=Candidatus Beckwithbacteria bacterium GW2011_GWA2_43_10 TaxID=1618369 RepID=A0A0G1C411_9BACT|nr:MAG: ABC transporter, ATPase subunit [Candidatus Beckwithbacteria bacterium GW2011_GWA2_43_10]